MVHLHKSQRASQPWRRRLVTAAALSLMAISGGAAHAAGAERSLAGISIFSPGSEVTRKFGNPSRILVGGIAPGDVNAGGTGSGPGGQGATSGSPSPYPGSSGSSPYPGSSTSTRPGAGLLPGFPGVSTNQSSLGGYPGAGGGFAGQGGYPGQGGGGYPGQGGGGYPGAPGGGFPGAPGGGITGDPNAPAAPVKEPVTLIYDRQNGGSLEFTISPDKRVVQIRETGYSGAYGTSRGTRLGTSYAAVVGRYGYPENTTITGPIINIDYKDTLHCGFQFLNQKLVAIIVAAPD